MAMDDPLDYPMAETPGKMMDEDDDSVMSETPGTMEENRDSPKLYEPLKSTVELVHVRTDRCVWKVGSGMLIKENVDEDAGWAEARTLEYVGSFSAVKVPALVNDWREPAGGRHFMIQRRIPGQTLRDVWEELTPKEKDSIAMQTGEMLKELRKLTSEHMRKTNGYPPSSRWLYFRAEPDAFGFWPVTSRRTPFEAMKDQGDVWKAMSAAFPDKVDAETVRRLGAVMPAAGPFTLTHGDLTLSNIIVKDGKLAGIIDWETAAYFPVWWEYVRLGLCSSDEDQLWKMLLRGYMDEYDDADEFWNLCYNLAQYPDDSSVRWAVNEYLEAKEAENGFVHLA